MTLHLTLRLVIPVISRLILCVRGGQIWRERQEEAEGSDWLIPG